MLHQEALVIKSTGKNVELKTLDGRRINARIRGKLKLLKSKETNPVAVGDNVLYSTNNEGEASIEKVLERKNCVVRKATRLSKQTQVIAANLDLACLVVSIAEPSTPLGFVDRFLAITQAYSIPTILAINKQDLIESNTELSQKLKYFVNIYQSIGYKIFVVSAKSGFGLEKLEQELKGNLCLFSGQSGVGKSSLANALLPGLLIKTKEVSDKNNKGQHTTTFAQMYEWPFGGAFIDTPGIKEFGVVNVEKRELQSCFVEIFELSEECKFDDCLHINEPDCRVLDAVKNQTIQESRYRNYLHILQECN